MPLFEDLITLKLLPGMKVLVAYSSIPDFDPHHSGAMLSDRNRSNGALNTRVPAPRYDNRCKIQVLKREDSRSKFMYEILNYLMLIFFERGR